MATTKRLFKTKSTIYIAAIRPVIMYTAETRPERARAKKQKTKILCRITDKALMGRKRTRIKEKYARLST